MIKANNIAKVYAKSLLDLANSTNHCEQIYLELEEILAILKKEPSFKKLLESPLVSTSQREECLKNTFGNNLISELLYKFILLLNRKKRIHFLEDICAALKSELNNKLNRVAVKVTTTTKLSTESKELIKNTLKSNTGKDPIIEEIISTSLLGGLKIQIEDTLFDGSIATRLRRLSDHMDDGVANDAEWAARGFTNTSNDKSTH